MPVSRLDRIEIDRMEVKTGENVAPQANGHEAIAAAVAGKSGKKKAKRKNKSKNIVTNASQEEHPCAQQETEGDDKITSKKQNGITQEDQQENSVEIVCQKLEKGLNLGKNGLTNGSVSESENHQVANPEPVVTTGKKKHKNKQKNKNQPAVVSGKEPQADLAKISEASKPKDPPTKDRTVLPANEPPPAAPEEPPKPTITYQVYESELQMPCIMSLIQKDLSEPYSIYTYRYFIHNWPRLCFLAWHDERCVGAIVCKLDIHRQNVRRGYIAMLAVDKDYRKLKIGTTLVQKAIQAMLEDNADEVVLETEITNRPALRLYENLGFVRDKRLFHYYLNGVDALRLKLWFR